MNMMNFADINLKDVQIVIDGVAMRPRIVDGTMCIDNPYTPPILKLDMEVSMINYEKKKMIYGAKNILNEIHGVMSKATYRSTTNGLSIVNVIFNEPATIVFWSDKSKTVVKTQNGEPFDPEKGLAMAILKRMQGNKGNYNNEFHQWTKNYQPKETNE